jgi:hypothetical protein
MLSFEHVLPLVAGGLCSVPALFAVYRSRYHSAGPLSIPPLSYIALTVLFGFQSMYLAGAFLGAALSRSFSGLAFAGHSAAQPETLDYLLLIASIATGLAAFLSFLGMAAAVFLSRPHERLGSGF